MYTSHRVFPSLPAVSITMLWSVCVCYVLRAAWPSAAPFVFFLELVCCRSACIQSTNPS